MKGSPGSPAVQAPWGCSLPPTPTPAVSREPLEGPEGHEDKAVLYTLLPGGQRNTSQEHRGQGL